MPNLSPSRLANRSHQEAVGIRNILEETLYCTIAYSVDQQAYAIPTGFVLMGDQLIIHGSNKSHFLTQMPQDQLVCLSAFLFDGLVLAKSAFHHSVNYRSVVLYAQPQEITKQDEKLASLKAFTDKYVPGRWEQLRPITEGEIQATMVLGFDIKQASAKLRSGPPSPEPADRDFSVWTGVIPATQTWGTPIPAPDVPEELSLPAHLNPFRP